MQHSHMHCFSRFILTLLLCGLLWSGLERISVAANLIASDPLPSVFFNDTDTASDAEWQILADQVAFNIIDRQTATVPFLIEVGAPFSSIKVAPTGNVGLGTSFPAQKLHLVTGALPTIRLEQDGTSGLSPHIWDLHANDLNFYIQDTSAPQFSAPFVLKAGTPSGSLYVAGNGRVGLGTATPQGNLHIFGTANQDLFSGIGPDLTNGPSFNFGYSGNSFGPGSGFFNVRGTTSGVNPSLRFATVNVQRMIITNAGRVGIGTTSPGVALDVVGTVRASNGVMVGSTTLTVPDYVFAPDYQLRPLPQLAAYVEKERHLPDVPSAQEIKARGVNLSELQMQLLKKVEELTLYTLQQEKINRRQEQKIQQLTARLAVLERTRK